MIKMSRQVGDIGERAAEKYLKKRGWRIISNNFSSRSGEIDLIGYRFGTLVYFEVKTRSNLAFGAARDAVDDTKILKIKRTAKTFLQMYGKNGCIPVFYPFGIQKYRFVHRERIDVIEIYISRDFEVREINHIKDWGNRL